jgi:inner membrane protein involved in colicin E2 resistance
MIQAEWLPVFADPHAAFICGSGCIVPVGGTQVLRVKSSWGRYCDSDSIPVDRTVSLEDFQAVSWRELAMVGTRGSECNRDYDSNPQVAGWHNWTVPATSMTCDSKPQARLNDRVEPLERP